MSAYLPALLLLLFSTWCGTFDGAAHGGRSVAAHLALVTVLAVSGNADPLRLGRRSNRWLALLVIALVLSGVFSSVSRAGLAGLLLLPAFLMVPAFVERCWPGSGDRRRGLAAVSAVVAAVAVWSLVGWGWLGTPGASLPLGHHNLLAAWLVTLLPLAVLSWREGATARLLAGAAGVLALVALVSTRSLTGLVALGAVLTLAAFRHRPRWWLGVAAVLAVLASWPDSRTRIVDIATGEDSSVAARLGYLEAAWEGFTERPFLGWGTGSANWTLGLFLRPRPGIHPPGEVVTDPHSLPAKLLYENGLVTVAFAVALGLAYLSRRRRARSVDSAFGQAAALGILGFSVAGLAGRPFAAPALPLAAMIVLGALQASEGPRPSVPSRRLRIAAAFLLTLALVPVDTAHLLYERASRAPTPERRVELLERSLDLDPHFPLYRARLALAERDLGRGSAAASALEAAEDASGIAPFFLLAGVLGEESQAPWATGALLRACRLDPLGALAPFHLAVASGDDPRAPVWAARFLLAEPYLAAAEELVRERALLAAAMAEIRALAAVDPTWADGLAASLDKAPSPMVTRRTLVLEMDGDATTSLSFHAFRRRPWPARIDEVTVLEEALPEVPALSRQRGTDTRIFEAEECGLVTRQQRDAPPRVPPP